MGKMHDQIPQPPFHRCSSLRENGFHGKHHNGEHQHVGHKDQHPTLQRYYSLSEKLRKEIEALEACKWLRAAGFPQYAQMYEEHQFPIEIGSVEKDHDFLDQDSIQALFRRLTTLNKCATMKIEAPQRKSTDDSDEEEQCALSDKWKYQRSSRRWSRRDLDPNIIPEAPVSNGFSGQRHGIRSSSSHDSVITDLDDSVSPNEESPVFKSKSQHESTPSSESFSIQLVPQPGTCGHISDSDNSQASSQGSPMSPSLRRSASERFKGASKSFLNRMQSLKTKKSHKHQHKFPTNKVLEISGPTVVEKEDMRARMDRLGCVDISPTEEQAKALEDKAAEDRLGESLSASHSSVETGSIQKTGSTSTTTSTPTATTTSSDNVILAHNGAVLPHPHHSILSTSTQHSSASAPSTTEVLRRNKQPLLGTKDATGGVENRLSVYDNVPFDPEEDPQAKLDSILKDLYENISGLNKSLGEEDTDDFAAFAGLLSSGSSVGTSGVTSDHALGMDDISQSRPEFSSRPTSVADKPSENDGQKSQQSSSHSSSTKEQQSDSDNKANKNTKEADALDSDNIDLVDIEFINKLTIDTYNKATNKPCYPSDSSLSPNITNDSISSPQEGASDSMAPLSSHELDTSRSTNTSVSRSPDLDSPIEHDQSGRSGSSSGCSNHELSDHDGGDESEGLDPKRSQKCGDGMRERRDSGVGSSLTRAPSDRRRHRIRWHSFMKSHRPSLNSRNLQINAMSAGQMMVLRRLCLLKVTSLMEKYSPSSRTGWNWVMPKFMKRFKAPDYSDRNVFGVPLLVILQRTGQPLPQCILYAMRCLRRTAQDAVGIFRKSGVRSRIQKLRNDIEVNPEAVDFELLQPYDVADLIKQYFRELPECLLTNKMSESFINVFTHVPSEMRLEALQATVMLLPDENCEVLQSLLLFLSDMAEHHDQNQMTASNLAVCFAPSLFHLCGPKSNPSASPKRGRKSLGIPDQKELLDQKAAHECLTRMIVDCKKMFMVPEEMLSKFRFSYIEQGDPVALEDLGRKVGPDGEVLAKSDYKSYLELCIHGLLKEARDRFKGWVSVSGLPLELAYRKVGDGHPLRLWKSSVEVEAPPVEVLNRLLNERHMWDEDLLKWRTVEKLDSTTEVFQYVLNTMAPHPTRDICELRTWRTELPPKGACVLVSTSVEHSEAVLIGGIRATVLASRYLIEPCGAGKSRLTHIARVDIRGHSVEWYNKVYGHLCANHMARIRDSFEQTITNTDGPETKI